MRGEDTLSLQGSSVKSAPSAGTAREETALRQELRAHLLSLSFHAFEECLRHLLVQMGYTDVQLMGRTHWKGRNNEGGIDLQACSKTGVTASRIILQVKQYQRPVQRRFVDELRGTMLRTGATQGLLITTSDFPTIARITAARERLAPIRLVDGDELLDLLLSHQIGITNQPGEKRTFDAAYFADLDRRFPGKRKSSRREGGRVRNKNNNHCGSSSLPPGAAEKGDTLLWRTHVIAGLGSLWLLETIPGVLTSESLAPLALAASLGALLPDLDAERSKIQSLSVSGVQPFAPVSQALYRAWGHRGPLHSALGLGAIVLFASALAFWWEWPLSVALVLGYASHLLLDACTKSGIPLWYPKKKRYHLLPVPARLTTGSLAEDVFFAFLTSAVFLLLFQSLTSLILDTGGL